MKPLDSAVLLAVGTGSILHWESSSVNMHNNTCGTGPGMLTGIMHRSICSDAQHRVLVPLCHSLLSVLFPDCSVCSSHFCLSSAEGWGRWEEGSRLKSVLGHSSLTHLSLVGKGKMIKLCKQVLQDIAHSF